jgi:hypothetical protein
MLGEGRSAAELAWNGQLVYKPGSEPATWGGFDEG